MGKSYYPPMHSAEHILNQTMVRMFRCERSVNAHIEKKKSRIDYAFDRDISAEELKEIERRVNEVIARDLPVTEAFIPRAEAEQQFNLRRLPDTAGDPLRIIHIGDYDACPCIGTHVRSTREIGGFRIVSSSFTDGILRLRFRLAEPGTTEES